MTRSDMWRQKEADPLAKGQRWYCRVCNAKYRPKFGMLIELMFPVKGQEDLVPHYAKAAFPTKDIGDLKSMAVEKYMKVKGADVSTPEKLYAALPRVVPMDRETMFRPYQKGEGYDRKDDMEGVYKAIGYDIDTLPVFEWDQLYNLIGEEE